MARVRRLEHRWRTVYRMNDPEGRASEDFTHGNVIRRSVARV